MVRETTLTVRDKLSVHSRRRGVMLTCRPRRGDLNPPLANRLSGKTREVLAHLFILKTLGELGVVTVKNNWTNTQDFYCSITEWCLHLEGDARLSE